jgi:hypothetical protein
MKMIVTTKGDDNAVLVNDHGKIIYINKKIRYILPFSKKLEIFFSFLKTVNFEIHFFSLWFLA